MKTGKMARCLLIVIIAACNVVFSLVPGRELVAQTLQDKWLPGWDNRVKIIIPHSKIDEALNDFPVLIHLSRSSGINSKDLSGIFEELEVDDNRKKIAITTADSSTQCFIEIEEWDSSLREAWLWVKVPHIFFNEDTILYLYYDKKAADNVTYVGDTGSFAAQNVWSNNFVMVQHLSEQGKGMSGEFMDSTGRRNAGTGGGGNPEGTPARVKALTGYGQLFDGINDYIEIPDSDDFSINTTGNLTISIWISPRVINYTDSGGYIRWMGKGSLGQAEWQFRLYDTGKTTLARENTRSQWISFYVHNPEGGEGAGGGGPHDHLLPGDWIFLTARSDMVKSYLGFNGTPDGLSDSWSDFGIQYTNGSDSLRIGTLYSELNEWWMGKIDEVRISRVFRSNAWIKADYYSQINSLLFFAAEQARADIGDDNIVPETTPAPGNMNIPENERLDLIYILVLSLSLIRLLVLGIRLLRRSLH